jgi:hypothetical protein
VRRRLIVLAQQLEGSRIRDLYVHTDPLQHDGSLPLAKVSDRQNFGLALYVDFTATDEHWTAYRDGWV